MLVYLLLTAFLIAILVFHYIQPTLWLIYVIFYFPIIFLIFNNSFLFSVFFFHSSMFFTH